MRKAGIRKEFCQDMENCIKNKNFDEGYHGCFRDIFYGGSEENYKRVNFKMKEGLYSVESFINSKSI